MIIWGRSVFKKIDFLSLRLFFMLSESGGNCTFCGSAGSSLKLDNWQRLDSTSQGTPLFPWGVFEMHPTAEGRCTIPEWPYIDINAKVNLPFSVGGETWRSSLCTTLCLEPLRGISFETLEELRLTCALEQLDITPKGRGSEKGLRNVFGEDLSLVALNSSTEGRSSGRSRLFYQIYSKNFTL